MPKIEYVAGVCNIGPEEIARRRMVGWIGLAVFVVALILFVWSGINPWWRLFLFFPAAFCAVGFLQAYFRFCSGYARRGMFNLGAIGQQKSVVDEASKAKDRKKGNQIFLYAALIGAVVAVLSALL